MLDVIKYISTKQVQKEIAALPVGQRLLIRNVPNEVYHGELDGLSSTRVKQAFYSGKHYLHRKKFKESPAMQFGITFHNAMEMMIEEGAAVEDYFVAESEVCVLAEPKTNLGRVQRSILHRQPLLHIIAAPNSEQGKQMREAGGICVRPQDKLSVELAHKAMEKEKRIILPDEQYEVLSIGAQQIVQASFFKQLRSYEAQYVESSIFFNCPEWGLLKCRPDWMAGGTFVDWKTSRQVTPFAKLGDMEDWKLHNCRRLLLQNQYDISAAFYRYVSALDEAVFVLIDKEVREIYPCVLAPHFISKGEEKMAIALDRITSGDHSGLNGPDDLFYIEDYA